MNEPHSNTKQLGRFHVFANTDGEFLILDRRENSVALRSRNEQLTRDICAGINLAASELRNIAENKVNEIVFQLRGDSPESNVPF
ncbi:MAG: hypothetical protein MSG64_19745 [Pyrinomonadaceae bacterium MAG19_C2-C3]|nr:hypothetical protein [Pyrinomonadaceae bacterium MAG19_C2-C3]